jgi:predicted ferric reductase
MIILTTTKNINARIRKTNQLIPNYVNEFLSNHERRLIAFNIYMLVALITACLLCTILMFELYEKPHQLLNVIVTMGISVIIVFVKVSYGWANKIIVINKSVHFPDT